MVDSSPEFLSGGGEMGALIRAFDWTSTPLGRPQEWPEALRTAVGLLLGAKQPVYIAWGPKLTSLYNDGYIPIVGTKHPEGLGKPYAVLWAEIWDTFRPIVEATLSGTAQHFVDLPIAVGGRPEIPVGFFTFSYTALRDASGTAVGFYCAVTETTSQVWAAEKQAESASRLEMALSAGRGIGTWDWDIPSDRVLADDRFARLYGVDPLQAKAGAPIPKFFASIHPHDRARVEAMVQQALQTGEPFSEEYRLSQPDGSVRWVLAEGQCQLGPDGSPIRFPGVSFDISDRKEIEQRVRLLMREVNHRVKNQFAVILSMIRETTRRSESPADVERQIRARIMALSESHDLLVNGDWKGSSLSELIATQLQPFATLENVTIDGPEIVLSPNATQYLGIAFHELATNSSKYGALGDRGARLMIRWHVVGRGDGDQSLVLEWSEQLNAKLDLPKHAGFGSVVLKRVTPQAVGGVGKLDYRRTGVHWILEAPLAGVISQNT